MLRLTVACPLSHQTCWRVCNDTSDSSTGQDLIPETGPALQRLGPDCQEILEGEVAALFFFLPFSHITQALFSPLQSHPSPVITRFTHFQYLRHYWGWCQLHPCEGPCILWDILRELLWFAARASSTWLLFPIPFWSNTKGFPFWRLEGKQKETFDTGYVKVLLK